MGHAGIEDKHPVSLVVEALDLGADLGQAGEKAFQGGLGPKKVDVSYADERHGLLPWLKLIDCSTNSALSEDEYFELVRQFYNRRNPHAAIGDDSLEIDGPDEAEPVSS